VVIKREQIQFKKEKKEEEPYLSQARALIYPQENLRVGMLFGMGLTHASDFEV